ncbi:uncharacterized protein LOC106883203 [Octopus bimaculoides]|uniref:Uncharacterized protein n=1 Tax=Octopus bimaculoides TaxID=37653 RepID=A0A0L8FI39_OCTBM|nr:uncharacterized protein LOC106883203 [Octopus bimaculoides]|eukprot:XP_014789611.1 PREDICTED: uncharacterized protein LOC106883203 [Octopus bimaculoides]
MIADSPVMASVCNTVQNMPEFYSCPQDYFDYEEDLNSALGDESLSFVEENNVREIEGLDSLFSLGVSDTERLCDNLLEDSDLQYVLTSYQYEMNTEPLVSVSFDWDDESISSSQTTSLADSAEFDMVDVCDTNMRTTSEQLEFIHKKCLPNGRCRWHQLTPSEQTSVIMVLSNLILELGPRERVEVLKLLNPNRKLSHFNMDSLVDPSWVTEKNIKLVLDYLKSPKANLSSFNEYKESQKPVQRRNRKKPQKRKASKPEDQTEKRVVQAVKEKKSGFFQKEIVVSLSLHEASDEEVDIDIIG